MGKIFKYGLCVLIFCFFLASLSSNSHAASCQTALAIDCDLDEEVPANTFVPSVGTIYAYDTANNRRFLFTGFLWKSPSALSWYKKSILTTLEPDIIFLGNNPYTTNFEPAFWSDMGDYLPPKTVVVTSSNFPCPYADFLADDNDEMITVGTACAYNLYSGLNQFYTTISRVNKNADSGQMYARFQRGSWGLTPYTQSVVYTPLTQFCLEPEGPILEMAPACIYSCCVNNVLQKNNYEVIKSTESVSMPGCYDWIFSAANSTTQVYVCSESDCADGIDNDHDGLVDCADWDCTSAPNCIASPDPCANKIDGYYCGIGLPNYLGDDDDRVNCSDEAVYAAQFCEDGCIENVPGSAYCFTPCAPVCSAGDSYCDNNEVHVCSANLCSYEYGYTCPVDQECQNGACVDPQVLLPVITNVSCTTYERGLETTCTITGSNFTAGGNTAIACAKGTNNGGAEVISVTPTQVIVHGNWDCNCALGAKVVTHRNGDNHITTSSVTTVMGPFMVFLAWPPTASAGVLDMDFGFNGCNMNTGFAPTAYVPGVNLSNVQFAAEDQVVAKGNVVGAVGLTGKSCVTRKAGAAYPGPDKWCCQNNCFLITN